MTFRRSNFLALRVDGNPRSVGPRSRPPARPARLAPAAQGGAHGQAPWRRLRIAHRARAWDCCLTSSYHSSELLNMGLVMSNEPFLRFIVFVGVLAVNASGLRRCGRYRVHLAVNVGNPPDLHAPSAELVACFPEHKSRGPGCFASLSKPAAGPDRATLSRARRRSRYGTALPPRTAGRRAEGRQAARFERTRPAPQDWAAQDS
jgi:hypothetical protein